MKNSEFKRKIDSIAKNIAEAQDITPDAKRFKDKLNNLANTLDPVINSISTTKELEDVITIMVEKMAQIDKVEAKTALANVIRKLNAGETGEMSPDIPPTTMNEAVTRWQKLAGIITENTSEEIPDNLKKEAEDIANLVKDKIFGGNIDINSHIRIYGGFNNIKKQIMLFIFPRYSRIEGKDYGQYIVFIKPNSYKVEDTLGINDPAIKSKIKELVEKLRKVIGGFGFNY